MSTTLIGALFGGAFVGAGLFVLLSALRPARPNLASSLAHLDTGRDVGGRSISAASVNEGLSQWQSALGSRLAAELTARGIRMGSRRSDLAVMGRSMEGFLASSVLLGVGGLLFAPVLNGLLLTIGSGASPALVVVLTLGFTALGASLPTLTLTREAAARRRDFRHAVGSFLDLVAMSLAGGRGVPEALTGASEIGGGWPFARIRDTLAFARLQGLTPWAALGRLGEELQIDELRDLSAALSLVADDGAKIRSSLAARAATLRSRELAETEGKAAERSQSMIVAQLLICIGFLLFIAYPAISRIFQ
ncbi:MAG TPA: type II secretion system F family protein [Mycobacteriales bacterium]|nr:type II secretion system F family protein [Mycobacteriales bacterium]